MTPSVAPEGARGCAGENPGAARLVVDGEMADDRMTLRAEARSAPDGLAENVARTLREVTKLRGEIAFARPGELPNDGKVIEDARSYR